MRQQLVLRGVVALTVVLGLAYVVRRWTDPVSWSAWWIAVPLVLVETYVLVGLGLLGATACSARRRVEPPAAPAGLTVDVFVTTDDEPVDLVMRTALAARDIAYPHRTWVLDDGARPALAEAVRAAGIDYVRRSDDWVDRPRHARAGNLNNALFVTEGEFLLVLDADQVPDPQVLDRTLGYFADPEVALVRSPQRLADLPERDPLGSTAPLLHGPLQQGGDGWDADLFAGSTAVLRRDALMRLGLVGYVRETERAVREALVASRRLLDKAQRDAPEPAQAAVLHEVQEAAAQALGALDAGEPLSDVTYGFQRRVDAISARVVADDVAGIQADLAAIATLPVARDGQIGAVVVDEPALERLADREWSPLGAVGSVQALVRAVDVDRSSEAQAVMPVATLSVTDDLATALRMHATGWTTVLHHESLATGRAPQDLGTVLAERLRRSQGALQALLTEHPLRVRGRRLRTVAALWSSLSGFAVLVLLAVPVLSLGLGVQPVTAWDRDLALLAVPYLVAGQLLLVAVAGGVRRAWRGQQWSFALFPVWVTAVRTAVAHVRPGRPLRRAEPPATTAGTRSWRLVVPQLVAMGLLVAAAVVGVVRAASGSAPWSGTAVNLAWVVADLALLGVVVRALRHDAHRGSAPQDEGAARVRRTG